MAFPLGVCARSSRILATSLYQGNPPPPPAPSSSSFPPTATPDYRFNSPPTPRVPQPVIYPYPFHYGMAAPARHLIDKRFAWQTPATTPAGGIARLTRARRPVLPRRRRGQPRSLEPGRASRSTRWHCASSQPRHPRRPRRQELIAAQPSLSFTFSCCRGPL